MTAQVSVVVPTRDRPGALVGCLAALDAQVDVGVEVVVVDDASSDAAAVARIVAEAGGEGGGSAVLVQGAGDGPAAARNLGARHATAPIVAFTDDDCRPEPDWAARLVAALCDGAPAVAGRTENGRRRDAFAAAAQTITNHLTESGLAADGRSTSFAPTCNLAVRADVFADLAFDESFPLAAGEDREWCDRLLASGRTLAYEPTAVVHHHPDLGWRGFWRQQVRYGRGAHHLRSTTAGGAVQRPGFYLDLLRNGFAQGPRVGALVLLAQLATATGIAHAALTRPRHPH